MSIFSGIEKATVYGASQYLSPGDYDLQVSRISVIDSSRTPGRQFFLVEFVVGNTTSEDFKVGAEVSWMVDLSRADTGLPNVKGFARALLPGTTDDDILAFLTTEDVLERSGHGRFRIADLDDHGPDRRVDKCHFKDRKKGHNLL